MTLSNEGRPSVKVPVLSIINVSILRKFSIAAASRKSTPLDAPRPVATMIDIGVANPKAHGQAIIKTATALISPYTQLGSGPNIPHPKKVRIDIPITTSTNQPAT